MAARTSYRLTPMLVARFWQKVSIKGPRSCWEWQALKRRGYGIASHSDGLSNAHRIAWFLVNGEIPPGHDICHRCDNPSCVNPAHLFAGTTKENIQDMERKGRARHPRGEQNGRARLNEEQVRQIKALMGSGMSMRSVARQFNANSGTIFGIWTGKIWKHVS